MSTPDLTDEEVDAICAMSLRDQLAWLTANWRRLVRGPDMATYQYAAGKGPARPGIYFLWGHDETLLYIGKSNNIRKRLLAHTVNGRIPFDGVSFIAAPIEVASAIEAAYIEALDPPDNGQGEPSEWARGYEDMVASITATWSQALRTQGSPA